MKKIFFTWALLGGAFSLFSDDQMDKDYNNFSLLPPSRYEVQGRDSLLIYGDFLYWKVEADGLYYAVSGLGQRSTDLGNPAPDFIGELKRVDHRYDPAFRIGVGNNTSYDDWDFFLFWTRMKTKGSSSFEGDSINLWGHSDINELNYIDSGSASYRCRFDIIDLDFGRGFYLSKWLAIRPFLGAEIFLLDQDLNVDVHFKPKEGKTLPLNGKTIATSDYNSGGVVVGVKSRVDFKKGWSLFGLAKAARLYGKFRAKYKETEDGFIYGSTEKDSFYQAVSYMQGSLGVGYDYLSQKGNYHLGFKLGWELHSWIGVERWNHYLSRYTNGTHFQENGNMTAQGLMVQALLHF